MASTVRALLHPRALIGATAVSVLAGGHEVEETVGDVGLAARGADRRRSG